MGYNQRACCLDKQLEMACGTPLTAPPSPQCPHPTLLLFHPPTAPYSTPLWVSVWSHPPMQLTPHVGSCFWSSSGPLGFHSVSYTSVNSFHQRMTPHRISLNILLLSLSQDQDRADSSPAMVLIFVPHAEKRLDSSKFHPWRRGVP